MTSSIEAYGGFLNTIPDAAFLVDAAGTIQFANVRVPDLFGYAADELIGEPVHRLVPARYRATHPMHVAAYNVAPRARQLGTLGETLHATHRDGRDIPVDIMLAPVTVAGTMLTMCLVRDLRKYEALRNELRVSEDRFRNLVERAQEVFYAVDLSADPLRGQVTYVSPQATALTGHPAEAFIQDSSLWAHLIHPEDVPGVMAATTSLIASGQEVTRKYRIRHIGADEYRSVEDNVVPRRDAQGRVTGYQGVARDTTEAWWQSHHLETLVTVGTLLHENRSRDLMLHNLLDGLLPLLEVNGAAFATCADEAAQVEFELGRGALGPWTGRSVSSSVSRSAKVIRSGIPWVTNSAATAGVGGQELPSTVTAYASIPVRTPRQVIGALVVTKAFPFRDEEVQVLRAVGEMAATALERQRLHDQIAAGNAELEEAYERTIEGWARALDMRDRIAEGHTRRVTEMTLRLARRLGVPDERLGHLRRGAMLHDIGKMAVPDAILQKPGPLTAEERAVMRQHVTHAYELLGPIEFLRPALEIPYFHHERWDGSGYPRGLKGDAIPEAARIFAVADVYDAITSERPYAAAESHQAATDFIVRHSGIHFDPRVVDALRALNVDAAP